MMFQAVCDFRDLTDGHMYLQDEPFPFDGRTVAQERLEELLGSNNKARKPLIVNVPVAEEEKSVKPARKRAKPKE